MSMFDRFRSSTSPSFDPQRAVMTFAVAAVKADGHVADEEIARLLAMCNLSPLFSSNSGAEDREVISFADNVTEHLPEMGLAEAAAALSPALRETAFAYACDMVLADGIIGRSEEELLTRMAEHLGVATDVGQAVIQTTLIRNRGG